MASSVLREVPLATVWGVEMLFHTPATGWGGGRDVVPCSSHRVGGRDVVPHSSHRVGG